MELVLGAQAEFESIHERYEALHEKKSQFRFKLEKVIHYILEWFPQPIFLSRVPLRSSAQLLREHLLEVDVKQQDCPSDRVPMKKSSIKKRIIEPAYSVAFHKFLDRRNIRTDQLKHGFILA